MKKLLAIGLALTTFGCGAELDRSSEVKTLRVLGVHKTESYAQPGDEVTFTMLWDDPGGRDVRPQWFVVQNLILQGLSSQIAGEQPTMVDAKDLPDDDLMSLCVNPPRDSYYGCLLGLEGALRATDGDALDSVLLANQVTNHISENGNSVTVRIPRSTTPLGEFGQLGSLEGCGDRTDDAPCTSVLHPTQDPRQPNLGSFFMWFALCPGKLAFDDSVKEGFPLLCLDDNDKPYGPEDYVLGYSQIYVYDNLQNRNPVMDAKMEIDGQLVDACLGPDCVDEPDDPPTECGDGVPCLDLCTKTNEDNCDEVDIKPVIPKSFTCNDGGEPDENGDLECNNAEVDQIALDAYGRHQTEQMWIRYYADQGKMASEVRLLNDALQGWNSDYGTKLRVPNEPGPVTIWAVAADNRGGQNWVRAHAVVR